MSCRNPLASDPVLTEAIVLLLSLEAWHHHHLRDELQLSGSAAAAVLTRALEALLSPSG
jgi:hypothetical protein